MEAVMTTTAKPKLRPGMRMSVDEFLDLPETDAKPRLELDDGVLYVMPRPRRSHQFLALWLGWHIANYLNGFAEPPAEVYPELVVILSRAPRRVMVPDLAIILRGRAGIFVGGYAEGAPDIVVEILSTNRRRDLVRKRHIYAAAGVKEYWIVDPRHDTVLPLQLHDGRYAARPTLGVGDVLTTPLLSGLAIPLAAVFEHRLRPPRDE